MDIASAKKGKKKTEANDSPKMNILFVASEAAPFAKEGGLGDVVGTLPKFLHAMGHDVRIVIPRYYRVNKEKYGLKPVAGPMGVWMGVIGMMWCSVYESRLPGSGVPVYFIEHEHFFGRDSGLYSKDGKGFLDNDNRFVFLSRAALELCKTIFFKPDVIHVHDWHTAIVPVFLNTAYRYDPLLGDCATLLTIHNMQHQGDFYRGLMDVLDIGREHFNPRGLEFYGRTNLLKGGLYHATLLNAVSPTYSEEIRTPAHDWRLGGVLRERASDLHGILNGVDYEEWNPETDKLIAANYSETDLSGKALCKQDLQKEFKLHERPEVPVIGLVSRLVKQKGIDILSGAIHRIMSWDVQFVLLGNGEPWAHHFFSDLCNRYPGRLGCYIGYSNPLAHKIEAGSDFFLMPSRFEPCGLNQMFSLRYGSVPIVRAVGGLNDTVENYNDQTGKGTGFKFNDTTPEAIIGTAGWAVHLYYNRREAIEGLVKRGMKQRFTWEDSAKKYEHLYLLAIKKRIGEARFNERFK